MRFFFLVVLTLFVAVAATLFTIFNPDPVVVDLWLLHLELPVATLVLLSMLLGALVGLALASGFLIAKQAEVRRLRKRYHSLEMEVDNLRKIPIKDTH